MPESDSFFISVDHPNLPDFQLDKREAFSTSGMAGIQDRHIVLFCHLIDRGEKADEVPVVVDVLLSGG